MTNRPAYGTKNAILLTLSLTLFGLAAWSCSESTGGNKLTTDGGPCDGALKDACGASCSTDDDCASGTHCSVDGTCWADCTLGGGECGAASACDDRGRCSGSGSGGAGGLHLGTGGISNTGGTLNTGGSCGSVDVSFEPTIPAIVMLIDQSGSMTADFNGQGSRWNVVYDALMGPNAGVVMAMESQVRFGLALYTYTSGPTCPELVEVLPPALDAHAAIDVAYAPEVPLSNTPTGDSISAITPALAAFAEPGPKLIILATDGDPDRCEDPDGHDQVSMDEATDAAQAAYQQGIETVIIAVGDQVSEQHQQDMANAGSGRPVPSSFPCDPIQDPATCAQTYEPTTQQALIDALTAIILGQRSCVFALDGAVIAGKECEGTVMVNNVELGCNDPDGWQLNSASEIEFLGAACDTILNDPNVIIEATFPCDAISPPPG